MTINKRFAVTDHWYGCTGGGHMTAVFMVFDRDDQSTKFVICDDDGFSYQTVNTVNTEMPDDFDLNRVSLRAHHYCELTSFSIPVGMPQCEYDLFKWCQFEYYKLEHQSKSGIEIPVTWLPKALRDELGPEVIKWHEDNCEPVSTDGVHAYPSYNYPTADESTTEWQHEQYILEAKKFLDYLNSLLPDDSDPASEERFTSLYEKQFTIVFNGRSLEVPFLASCFTAITDALAYIIDQE